MTGRRSPEWPWLWREVRPFVLHQVASLVMILAATALGLLPPLIVKWLIDEILPNRRWGALGIVTAAFLGGHLLRSLLASAADIVNVIGVQRIIHKIRVRLLAHLQSRTPAFYGEHAAGDLVQRLDQDVSVVGEAGSSILPSIVRGSIELVLTITTMLVLDWRLGLIVLPMLPAAAYVQYRYRTALRNGTEQVREAVSRQNSLAFEALTGVIHIQLLGAERRFLRRYRHRSLKSMQAIVTRQRHEDTFSLLASGLIATGTALIVGYGGVRVMLGELSTGALVAMYGYLAQTFSPMATAAEFYARLARLRVSVRRLIEIEMAADSVADRSGSVPMRAPRLLNCIGVKLAYRPEQPALRRVDLSVKAGERVAMVGESGCGKSSLLKLIPRLYDVTDGRLEIDGLDLRSLQVHGLREAVSFVPQEPMLFQGTLSENLRYGNPSASQHDIAHAAWIACATDLVSRLSNGWETRVGPWGAELSGGEKQRIAIMRALLQRRPILILDEATSALDAATEHMLLSRLQPWCADRIVIAVSHRLSMARWATRVVVMREGEIVEDGTHAMLYRPGTHYYALWQHAERRH